MRRKELIAEMSGGYHLPLLFFWGHTPSGTGQLGPYVLSQWYEHVFEHRGREFTSSEQVMMFEKAVLFDDQDTAEKILRAESPRTAKSLGREVRGFNEPRWAEHRFDIVVQASISKFASSADLTAYLLGTGDHVLVEASPYDRIWGIGLTADDEAAADPRQWNGLNLLGFALMKARALLAEPKTQSARLRE